MTEEYIKTEDLLEEVKCALSDCFVAEIAEQENCIILQFENGQKFRVELKEVK